MIAEDVQLGWIVQAAQLAVTLEQTLQNQSLAEGAVSLGNKRAGYANAIDAQTAATFGNTQDDVTKKYMTIALIGGGTLIGIFILTKILSKKG
jgi:hypothetical protein